MQNANTVLATITIDNFDFCNLEKASDGHGGTIISTRRRLSAAVPPSPLAVPATTLSCSTQAKARRRSTTSIHSTTQLSSITSPTFITCRSWRRRSPPTCTATRCSARSRRQHRHPGRERDLPAAASAEHGAFALAQARVVPRMSEATSGMPHGADPHIAPLMRAKGLSAPAQRGGGTTRSMMEGQACSVSAITCPTGSWSLSSDRPLGRTVGSTSLASGGG